MNHVSSCPFLPSNVGVQRLKEASYSDIDIRSSSKSSTSETSSSEGSSVTESTEDEQDADKEGEEEKEENISLKSSSSLVQRVRVRRSSSHSDSKYKSSKSGVRKSVKLEGEGEEEEEAEGEEMKKVANKKEPEVQIISRGADGRAIVKITRKSASSFSAESMVDEKTQGTGAEGEADERAGRRRDDIKKKKKRKKKKRKEREKKVTKCSYNDNEIQKEHSIARIAGPCDSFFSEIAISHDKTREGPNAHTDSVPRASSQFPVSPKSPSTVPAANSSSVTVPLSSPAILSFSHVHGDDKSNSQTAKSSSSHASLSCTSPITAEPTQAESSCSFWPSTPSSSKASRCNTSVNVSVFPDDTTTDKRQQQPSRQLYEKPAEEKAIAGKLSTRSSSSLRRAFFADFSKSPETLVEEEEEFLGDEWKPAKADERAHVTSVSSRQQSSRDEGRSEGSREGQASVNKYIPRAGVKEQFDIEMGSSDGSQYNNNNMSGESSSHVNTIASAKGASSSSLSSLAWAKPSGIRAFLKASFRSSKSQSVDITMIPEVDSSDDRSASSATSTPVHCARQASESSHLLPSTSAGASSSSSSAIAKRGKRMKSVKSLQSPVSGESIPLPVVSSTSNAYTSYQATSSAPTGIHHSSLSSASPSQLQQPQQAHSHNPHAHSRSQQVTSPSSLPLSPSPSPSTSMSGSGLRLGGSHSSSSIKRRSPSTSMSKRRASSAATVVSITGPGASSSATVMSLPRPSVGSLAHSPSAGKRFL